MKTSSRTAGAVVFAFVVCLASEALAAGRWTAERANAWWAQQPFRAGGNYVASTAINQLEMWQAATFDPATIDREFGWAQEIGFNTMRVFLHNLPWREDPAGCLARIDTYLQIADKHGIATPPATLRRSIEVLKSYGRPLLCTEYMARPRGSRFETNLPVLKENKVAAIAWGFIAGRSQTNYPWDSWAKPYKAEPPEWFHDVLRADGRAYRPDEFPFLKRELKSP